MLLKMAPTSENASAMPMPQKKFCSTSNDI